MERILLAEDETTNRRLLAAYLHRAGYEVDEVEDGEQAWEKLVASPHYALVVTDRNMPELDGLALFRKMQATDNLNTIPVIMQTAADTPQEVVEGIEAGVYYYLTKPYQELTLITLVQAAIRERKQNTWINARLKRQQDALGKFVQGEFHVKRPQEAQNLAYLLGSLFPRPEQTVSALYELLLNAIEHGNLGIGYNEKSRLLAAGEWEKEISRRLDLPEHAAKKVVLRFSQSAAQMEVTITDEGQGFDWRPFLEIEPSRAMQSNGRGIAKANLLGFDKVIYKGKGNEVYAAVLLGKSVANDTRPPSPKPQQGLVG